MTQTVDWARISAVLAVFVGVVVLRALHDIPVADFDRYFILLVGVIVGQFAAVRPGRKTDPQ